jgi:hypothetical protein
MTMKASGILLPFWVGKEAPAKAFRSSMMARTRLLRT